MKNKKKIHISLFFLLFVFIHTQVSYAYDQVSDSFSYHFDLPENQIDKDLGYYHLKVSPGSQQKLQIKMNNPTEETIIIDVDLNGTKTNSNGVLEYGSSKIENDKSLVNDFREIVTAPDFVELKPGENKNLEIDIQMPNKEYDGVISGGIQLMERDQLKNNQSSQGANVFNQYAYIIGILLQENDTIVKPELKLNSVKAGQNNSKNAILVNYSNINAAYLNDMTTEVKIMEKNKDIVIFERKQTSMRMAPNSFIEFALDMNGQKMVSGEYTSNIIVTSGDMVWEWTDDFTITSEEANKFNDRDISLVQEKGIEFKLVVTIATILFILIVIFLYIIYSIKKNKKKSRKRRI